VSITLYHHPYTRAASVVWQLEEVGQPYTLRPVHLSRAEHKQDEVVGLNPMGKLPVLVDDGVVVTEVAAIGLYLADRYAAGCLAPDLNDPRRGPYLRWALFCPSVVEPGSMAKASGWTYREGAAGWGNPEAMVAAIGAALRPGPFVLGDDFSMVDVILGSTLRYMVMFKMLEADEALQSYLARIDARPAYQRAQAVNAEAAVAMGL
jgi:glutathione S-transferase